MLELFSKKMLKMGTKQIRRLSQLKYLLSESNITSLYVFNLLRIHANIRHIDQKDSYLS